MKGDAKKALRGVIERYELPVTLTANQNIILREVDPAWKEDIEATLAVSSSTSSEQIGSSTSSEQIGSIWWQQQVAAR